MHAQDDLYLRILRILEGTFSLDAANIIYPSKVCRLSLQAFSMNAPADILQSVCYWG